MTQPTKLFNKNFFLLWQGQLVSQLGNQAFFIAMMFWLKETTDSATLIGLIMMVTQLPAVLLGPLAGTFADSHSRKNIIVFCDLINGVAVMTFAVIVFLNPGANDFIVTSLFVVSVVTSIIGVFFRPAVAASIPDIVPVEKLAAANSMNQSSVQLSTFVGQGIGGVLYKFLGAPLLFLIDGITYIFSGISEMFITIPQKLDERPLDKKQIFEKFKKDTIDGFKFVWKNRGIKNLIMIASTLNFFLTPIVVLLPFYVGDVLKVEADWYGYILGGFGAGALVGYLFAGKLKITGQNRAWLILISLFVQSVLIGAYAVIYTPIIALVSFVCAGVLNGYININIITVLQITTPSEIRGRVFSVLATFGGGLVPISMGLSGIITDMINKDVQLLYLICGSVTAVVALLFFPNKTFRDFLAIEHPTASTS